MRAKLKKVTLPKGVEPLTGGELAHYLRCYGKCGIDGKFCTGEDATIGRLIRELAWRRGALTARTKKGGRGITPA